MTYEGRGVAIVSTICGPSGICFDSPKDLRPANQAQGIDSAVETWTGDDFEVTVDQGPFVDPLTRYGERPEFVASDGEVAGRPVRVVEFIDDDGSRVTGAHFPGQQGEGESGVGGTGRPPVTVIVRSSPGMPKDAALQVVHSIRFPGA
ncbi:hypothetical protein ACFXGT_29725 [Streptomyces sp. NPDC059352]|uniref:hypothetical protein n=1 Tax=Streptomyces sp. NPDC059352 TaxID=3346810 RepID=UPI00368FDD45